MQKYIKIETTFSQVTQFYNLKNSILLLASICVMFACSQVNDRPQTRQVEHYDEYHGLKVLDAYRWLENFTSDEVKAWVDTQNKYTQSFLSNDDLVIFMIQLHSSK